MSRALRVLVVDDSHDVTEMVGVMLEHFGHASLRAHTGAEALEVFATARPDVVLLDLGLPDADGCAVAEEMHRTEPGAVLVALTGYGDDHTLQAVNRSGFSERLLKPLRWSVLEELLARASVRPEAIGAAEPHTEARKR